MRSSVLRLGVPVVAAVLFYVLFQGLSQERRYQSPVVGQQVREFSLPPLFPEQPPLTSAELASGSPVLLNFFASWCASCLVEHPLFMEIRRQGTIPVHGIAFRDEPEDTRAWLKRYGDPYSRIGVDRQARVAIDFGVSGIPETFLVDGTGRVVAHHQGALQPGDWESVFLPELRRLAEQGGGARDLSARDLSGGVYPAS